MNTHELLRSRLLASAGIHPPPKQTFSPESFRTLASSQWSDTFETLMRNRLQMGLFRYGRLGAKNKPLYNMVDSIIARARAYQRTGNDELLVDIANLALVEFVEGKHPLKHFSAVDDGQHCKPV